MTLLFMDGFHGGDATTKWSPGSSATRGTATPRFPGAAYSLGAGALAKQFTAASEIFVAAAVLWAGTATTHNISFHGDTNTTQHITVLRNASGQIEVRRGTTGGTLLATGPTVIPDGVWTHLQVRVVISDTVGVVEVRLNGASTNEVAFSGDTKNAGTASTVDAVRVAGAGSSYFWTDFVLLNTAGSLNNTWPGDVRVQTLVPTGDGNTSQGVGSDGNSVANWQLVDELPFASADYVGITTDGQGDTYALGDLAAGTSTVKAIQVSTHVAKSDAGAKSVKRRVRSAGTTYAGTAVALATGFATVAEVLETDPATTVAWTASAVNGLEAGVEAAA